jgi:adrenodoxin-NADP+ reductase
MEHVLIISQGNVTLDVTWMLLTSPRSLEKYDIAAPVLDVLRHSAICHISIIRQHGLLQAAFTMKELRELTTLVGTPMVPLSPELTVPPPTSLKLTWQQSRALQLLQQSSSVPSPGAMPTTQVRPPLGAKAWSLGSFHSPMGFTPDSQHLMPSHTALNGCDRTVPTGQTLLLRMDLIVTMLGQHADPLQAHYDPALGHLTRQTTDACWMAWAARGVLTATMIDVYAIAGAILADHHRSGAGRTDSDGVLISDDVDPGSMPKEIEQGVKDRHIVQYDQWKKVDAEEVQRGKVRGKERERMGWGEACEFLMSARAW